MAANTISPMNRILNAAVLFVFFLLLVFTDATRDRISRHGRHGGGFSAAIFRRDSPRSPLYNPSLSRYDRLSNAFRRSFSRSRALARLAGAGVSPDAVESPITPGAGEFLMDIAIGTPPVDFIAIADTGSDLIWTQCLPCKSCYNQSQPIFNPRRSSSYRPVPCDSGYCSDIDYSGCHSGVCEYTYSYGDDSSTAGELGDEELTIGSAAEKPFKLNAVVGCGHENGGTFDASASGIIGLGGGDLSLISQLSKTSRIPRLFSYCLPSDQNRSSEINFGKNAVVSGRRVVSTPLVSKSPNTYYFLNLEAVSVGDTRHPSKLAGRSDPDEMGNIIIDSGTTLTFLPQGLYTKVVSELEKAIRGRRVDDPNKMLDLCYAVDGGGIELPVVTAHFTGADVELRPVNTFAEVANGVVCLTFAPSEMAIFGNLAQLNYLIGYDLDDRKLSFSPTACS